MTATIWDKLTQRLGRQPTNAEAKAEVKRILNEAIVEAAQTGKLSHQRRRKVA